MKTQIEESFLGQKSSRIKVSETTLTLENIAQTIIATPRSLVLFLFEPPVCCRLMILVCQKFLSVTMSQWDNMRQYNETIWDNTMRQYQTNDVSYRDNMTSHHNFMQTILFFPRILTIPYKIHNFRKSVVFSHQHAASEQFLQIGPRSQ